jgi:hypothetical protein
MGAQMFEISRGYLKIIGTGMVTHSKFHAMGPKILGATLKKFSSHSDLVPRIGTPLF